jgi:hypothetical protein
VSDLDVSDDIAQQHHIDFLEKEGLGTDVWQFDNIRPPLCPQYCRSQNMSPPPLSRYCRSQNIRQLSPVFRLLSSETSDSTWELASDLPPPPLCSDCDPTRATCYITLVQSTRSTSLSKLSKQQSRAAAKQYHHRVIERVPPLQGGGGGKVSHHSKGTRREGSGIAATPPLNHAIAILAKYHTSLGPTRTTSRGCPAYRFVKK